MSGEIEAAGALATAGLVAGVIEGREGGQAVEGVCLNCDAQLSGAYCSQCGQHARPLRSLRHVAGEFLHNLFHFDTKAWRTLPMVIFRPGTLTRDYVYGKRARYISPLATFLMCVFLMFFVFSFVGGAEFGGVEADVTQEQLTEARADLEEARASLAALESTPSDDAAEGMALDFARNAVQIAEAQVAELEAQLGAEELQTATEPSAAPDVGSEVEAEPTIAPETTVVADEEATVPSEDVAVGITGEVDLSEGSWQDQLREGVDNGDVNVNTGNAYLDERIRQTLRNPDLALFKVQEAASKFSFLLAPLSLPFIALLFLWKRGVTFYDHVVYALYALSFASILFITFMLGAAVAGSNVGFMVFLSNALLVGALPVHTFFHLGGAYRLRWWSALWRTVLMLFFALFIATIFLLFVIVMGLVG